MTITMSQPVSTVIRDKASAQAASCNENIAVVASEINGKPVQMLFPISIVENSPNKDSLEVIAVIDKDGKFVD